MKKKALYVLVALLVVVAASAAVVNYLSNTITEDVAVNSPVTLEGTEFSLDIEYSGEDDFALIKITNNANVPTEGDLEIAVTPDIEGLHIAITEDINYCFSAQGDMTGVADCELDYLVWLNNNPDWMDWVADEAYSDSTYSHVDVINHGGNSWTALGYTGDALVLPGLVLPAETTLYGIMYVASESNLAPGTYNFDVTLVP